jgi:hypothetical protein
MIIGDKTGHKLGLSAVKSQKHTTMSVLSMKELTDDDCTEDEILEIQNEKQFILKKNSSLPWQPTRAGTSSASAPAQAGTSSASAPAQASASSASSPVAVKNATAAVSGFPATGPAGIGGDLKLMQEKQSEGREGKYEGEGGEDGPLASMGLLNDTKGSELRIRSEGSSEPVYLPKEALDSYVRLQTGVYAGLIARVNSILSRLEFFCFFQTLFHFVRL